LLSRTSQAQESRRSVHQMQSVGSCSSVHYPLTRSKSADYGPSSILVVLFPYFLRGLKDIYGGRPLSRTTRLLLVPYRGCAFRRRSSSDSRGMHSNGAPTRRRPRVAEREPSRLARTRRRSGSLLRVLGETRKALDVSREDADLPRIRSSGNWKRRGKSGSGGNVSPFSTSYTRVVQFQTGGNKE